MNIILIIYTVFWSVIFFVAGFILIVLKSHNVKVIMFEESAGGTYCRITRAKIVNKPEHRMLKFFMSTKTAPLFNKKYFIRTGKKNSMIQLYQDSNGRYHPIRFHAMHDNSPDYTKMDAWYMQTQKRIFDKYERKKGWEKYAPVIIIGGTLALCTVLMIVYGHFWFDSINNSVAPAASKIEGLVQQIEGLAG
jgi:hypothetical protein